MSLSVIITAAGSSRRMGGINKLMLPLGDKPVLAHTLELFNRLDFVDCIVVTASANCVEEYRELCKEYGVHKLYAVVEGGKERQDSINIALQVLRRRGCRFVAVHDGARPLVSEKLVSELYTSLLRSTLSGGSFRTSVDKEFSSEEWLNLERALDMGGSLSYDELTKSRLWGKDAKAEADGSSIAGVIPGVAVKDTIKRVDKFGRVHETLKRSELQAVQTPQMFRFDALLNAYSEAEHSCFLGTDDASLVERCGGQILVLPGEYTNLKITTVDDIAIARRLLEEMYV
ncbi:MAG: 2-C-methyl-D-erythritol 4-phosphate cytidylyltransferase [Candidatus Bruticola sp.]